jgi:hypothetical protein
VRGVDQGRVRELFGWLARRAGGGGPTAAALEQAVFARFARDHVRRFNVLEPSLSCDATGVRLYRFSYSLPDVAADPAGTAETLLALGRPFGPAVEDACRRVLRAARDRAVEQVIFGYADDGGGRSRVKLYLQFRAGAREAGLSLAGRLLARALEPALADAGALHLVGLDLGAHGLAGAKLYFLQDRVSPAWLAARAGRAPLVEALAEAGVAELRDVLTIHRLEGPDDDGRRPAEIDLSLADNDLLWSEVRALPPIGELLARHPVVGELESTFDLCVRRVSASLGDAGKLNVYYVLMEAAGATRAP